MSSIDERIVQMQFDNRQFEQGISQSMNSLNSFDSNLKGLNSVSLANLANSIENLSNRFSTLGIVGITVLQNLTNRVVDAGIAFAKSLTFDQLDEGFAKYSSGIKDVRALMNSSDKSVEDIEGYIQKLAWYSDATSYSYSAMVTALKNFSAQNIPLEESAKMIMGIGNSLSYAGLAAEEAGNLFNVYSKAIGQGYMSLIQWKSLNLQGASTMKLREQFIQAGLDAKTIKEISKGVYQTQEGMQFTLETFETSLSNHKGKWLTTDVMKKVFGMYGDYAAQLQEFMAAQDDASLSVAQAMDEFDKLHPEFDGLGRTFFEAAQEARTFGEAVNAIKDAASSSWRAVFQNVFGNAVEATSLWTNFSDWLYGMFMPPMELLDELTLKWNEIGGRRLFLESFSNMAKAIDSVLTPINEAFNSIFGEVHVRQIFKITYAFREFTKSLILDEVHMERLKTIATAIISVFDVLKTTAGTLIRIFKSLVDPIKQGFTEVFDINLITIANKLSDLTTNIKEFVSNLSLSDRVLNQVKTISKAFFSVLSVGIDLAKSLIPIALNIGRLISPVASIVLNIASSLSEYIIKATESIKFSGSFSDGIKRISDGFTEFLISAKPISTFFDVLGRAIGFAFEKVKEFGSFFLSYFTPILKTFTEGIGFQSNSLTGLIGAIIGFNWAKNLSGLAVWFGDFRDIFDQVSVLLSQFSEQKYAEAVLTFAKAVLIISGSLLILASISPDRMASALIGLSVALTLVTKALKGMSTLGGFNTGGLMGGILGAGSGIAKVSMIGGILMTFAAGIILLAEGLKILSTIDIGGLVTSLIALKVILLEMQVFLKSIDKLDISKKLGWNILLMSAGIIVMAQAIKQLGALSPEQLITGLAGMAGALLAITLALNNLPNDLKGKGSSILVASASLTLIATSIKMLSDIGIEQLLHSSISLILMLAAVTTALNFAPDEKTAKKKGAAILIASAALIAIASALKLISQMSVGQLIQSGLALGVMLAGLVVALNLMNGGIGGAAGLLIAAVALNLLVPPLMLLSQIDGTKMFTAIAALAGLILVLGGASIIFSGAILPMIGISAAIALLGLGLASLAVAAAAGAAGFVAAITIILTAIPNMMTALVGAITTLILALLAAIKETIPALVETIDTVVRSILAFLLLVIPEIVDVGMALVIAILDGIANKLPAVIDAAFNLILTFINGLADAITKYEEELADALAKLALSMMNFFVDLGIKLFEVGKQLLTKLWNGISSAFNKLVNGGTDLGEQAGQEIAENTLEGMRDEFNTNSPSKAAEDIGKNVTLGLANGLTELSSLVQKAGGGLGTTVLSSLEKSMGDDKISAMLDGLDLNPTITPVLDLSEIQNGSKDINSYLNGGVDVSTFGASNSAVLQSILGSTNGNGNNYVGGTVISFTQNNYSPKALNNVDIYRQTKTQLGALNGNVSIGGIIG